MAEWVDIPDFADGDIVRASTFQDMWNNLYYLKNGEHDVINMPGPMFDFWLHTPSTFGLVDSDYFSITFESSGGDLLILASTETSNANASYDVYATFTLDGVTVGGSEGLFRKGPGDIFELIPLWYVATGVSAGSHVIDYRVNGGAGDAKVFKTGCTYFSVMELN